MSMALCELQVEREAARSFRDMKLMMMVKEREACVICM